MVTIKEATENAVAFARAALGAERTRNVRLEEIESATIGGEDAWLITLSMPEPLDEEWLPASSIADVLGGRKREYKIFTVLKRNGEVTSMKMRELADV